MPEQPSAHGAPFAEFTRRLRGLRGHDDGADAGLTARELAEALWLARHVPPAGVRAHGTDGGDGAPGPGGTADTGTPASPYPEAASQRDEGRDEGSRAATARLHSGRPPSATGSAPASGTGTGTGTRTQRRALPVRAPSATALPASLPLQRALRPLQGFQPPVRTPARHLDEQATAERAAESGLLLPVLRASERREARLQLVMDVSTSTVLWQGALEELAGICAVTGAFREVRTQYVRAGADGAPLASPDRVGHSSPRRAEQLRDGTGRQLTLVLSDCAGPLWRSGQMQRLLHHWAGAAPVALVQPLPQRMWQRTHLPAHPGVLRRREGRGARLEFAAARGAQRPYGERAVPVPVLGLHQDALHTWARLLSGSTGLSQPGAAAWVFPDHPSAGPRPPAPDREPAERLRAFRRSASREAVHLAVCLSAAPLALPVMQLVQRTMLPESGPEVLAELVLSGLLRRAEGAPEGEYAFAPGVQERLLRSLPKGEAVLVLKHVSEYVEHRFGRGGRNFAAYAVARLTGTSLAAGPGADAAGTGTSRMVPAHALPPAFAEVPARVVRRFGLAPPPGERNTAAVGTLPGPPAPTVPGSAVPTPAVPTPAVPTTAVPASAPPVSAPPAFAVPTSGGAPAADLVRAATVRVEAGPGVPWHNGFFVAPQWVVTAMHGDWRERDVTVVTAEGERLRAEHIERGGKSPQRRTLALLHVPEAERPSCLWLAGQLPGGRTKLAVYGGSEGPPGSGPVFTSFTENVRAPEARALRLSASENRRIPRAGGPVLNATTGDTVGVLTVAEPGAGRWTLLPALPRAHAFPSWDDVLSAHDLHHGRELDRPGVSSVPGRFTSYDAAPSALNPVRRARLYGVLARLEPPRSARLVGELVGQVKRTLPASEPGSDRGGVNWRDGAALLAGSYDGHPGRELEAVTLYAAHVWAETEASGPAQPREELRAWTESIGRTLEFEPAREAVRRLLEERPTPGRAAQPEGRAGVCVEIEPVDAAQERYHWRVRVRHGSGNFTTTEAATRPVHPGELEPELSGPLASALELSGFAAQGARVQFSLERGQFDLPVDNWRVNGDGYPLGSLRHVTVAHRGRDRQARRRARWDGVHRGLGPALVPVRLLAPGASLAEAREALVAHPANAVPVHPGPVSAELAAEAMDMALDLGYGLALWRRDAEGIDADAFERRVHDMVRRAGDAEELLDLVTSARTDLAEQHTGAQWATGLAVLHDPPDAVSDGSWPLPAPRLRRRGT